MKMDTGLELKNWRKIKKENTMTLAKDVASHLLKFKPVYLKPEEPFMGIWVTDLYW